MEPEQAWGLIRKMTETITGWTPPQVRLLDLAFASLAALIERDKATQEAFKVEGEKTGKS